MQPIDTSGRAARHGASPPRPRANATAQPGATPQPASAGGGASQHAAPQPTAAPDLVRQLVRSLHLGEPMVDGPLCVLPLHSAVQAASKYVLLQQAIERGTVTITEVSDSGSVPHLSAVNKGPWPVLIFDGEELVGAKQNRIANATILVGVGKTMLPVSCVEAGRWSHRTASFDDGLYASHPKLRMDKERQVRAALSAERYMRERADAERASAGAPRPAAAPDYADEPQEVRARRFRSDQGAVWEEVARTQAEMCVASPTGALTDTFEAGRDELDKTLKALDLGRSPGNNGAYRTGRAVGAAVFVGGEFVCLDLLRPGKRFTLLYEKLLRGYALEAMLRKAKTAKGFDPEAATLRLLAELLQAGVTDQPSADLGLDLRLESRALTGSGLVWQNELLQLSLFPMGADEA